MAAAGEHSIFLTYASMSVDELQVPSPQFPVRTGNQEPGTRNREPGTWNSHLEPPDLPPTPMPDLSSTIRSRYGSAAQRVLSGEGVPAACCESTGCCGGSA